jgi:hypothetical protein
MTRSLSLIASLLAFLLLGGAPASAADKITQKRYPLPEQRGTFLVSAPASWKDDVNQPQPSAPPTILFEPSTGKPFQVLLTPIWKPRPDVPTPTKDALRQQVQRAADELKSDRIANQIKVVELQGKGGPGFYYSATDKAPKPGEFKYLTQGLIMASELMVSFTVLTNDGQEQVVRDALSLIRSSTHSPK